jgi:hypothetical protein
MHGTILKAACRHLPHFKEFLANLANLSFNCRGGIKIKKDKWITLQFSKAFGQIKRF